MSTRVSTVGNYSAVLANLMAAQQRQIEAGNQVATQKKGDDLKDYAKHAEMLTAMRAVQTRVDGYLEQNILITDKLATQDEALNQVRNAAKSAREAIAEALASGRADTLIDDLNAQLRNAVEGMNARYGGKYLFAGGQIDTRPVTATSMSDLTAPPGLIASFFQNDTFVVQAKIDDSTMVNTGVLANDIGTDLLTAFKTIETFHETPPDGPFSGALTDPQRQFLEGQLASWDQIHEDITNLTGRNGLVQKRVESVKADLTTRQVSLKAMVGGITDADMADAATRLQQAQISVQAAAQVFMSLQQSSLLNLLRS
jgi:flagellar hook-associated protein 3 FlgL